MADKNVSKFVPYGLRKADVYTKSREDVRVRRFLTPQRIVWTSDEQTSSITGANFLLEDREPQINLNELNPCVLTSKGGPAGILLDFGVEFHGSVKLYIWGVSRQHLKLRIRFGESVMEAMSELGGKKNATNDHISRDQEIVVGSYFNMPEIGPSGFRFVRIDLLDDDASISLKAVKGIATYRELEYKGSFNCNDERINTIWNTGAYTVHLNMQEYVWDGIKRDRLVWIGDMHPETSTIQAVFGYDDSVPASLDLARNETPLPGFMDGISSYSIWWIMVHYSWYMQNGDKNYLSEQREYLIGLLNLFATFIDEDGNEILPEARFIDWPSSENKEACHAGLQALLRLCLLRGAFLCNELGESEAAAKFTASADELLKQKPSPNGNKQAAALMVLAGLADAKEMNDNVMSVGGAHNLSTFLGYYVLQAETIAGNINGALDIIKNYWGAMLDRGATTFWEDFNLDWLEGTGRIDELLPEGMIDIHGDFGNYCYEGFRHSLCHGWASGPTAFLSNYVLGVHPAAPGCKKVIVKPNLGDLTWVEGTYPTPYGTIKVRHEKTSDGKIISKIEAPEGVEVISE